MNHRIFKRTHTSHSRAIEVLLVVLCLCATATLADIVSALRSVHTIIAYDASGTVLGEGSVVICSTGGVAVTCFHVLEDSTYSKVRLSTGRELDVVGYSHADPLKDFVVLQLSQSPDLYPIALASPDDVSIGDRVYTIGNPKGLAGTLADGIVSALREMEEFGKVIQTTAPISPGSSGGALVNASGALIGITKFFMADAQNLNFATPVEAIRPFLNPRDVKPLKTLPDAPSAPATDERCESLMSLVAEGDILTRIALNIAGKPESLKKKDATFPLYVIGLVENGKLSTAESEVKEYLKSRTGSDNLSLAIAYFYMAKGDFEKTLESMKKAEAFYKRAGEISSQVLAKDKTKPLACSIYMRALFALGQYDLLEMNSVAAVRAFPDAHFSWHTRLHALALAGRFEEARRFSDVLLKNKKMDAGSVHYWRGLINIRHIDFVRAQSQYWDYTRVASDLAKQARVDFDLAAQHGSITGAAEGRALLQERGYSAR